MIEKNQRLRNLKQLRREFGDACRQQRQKQGLELHLWESMTDIPSSFINAIEEGRANPDLAQCNYIASCLDKKLKIEGID